MPVAMICCSHSPLMLPGRVNAHDSAAEADIRSGFSEAAAWVKRYDPEAIVIFNPDHFNCFFFELLPAFCIGVAAKTSRDWKLPSTDLDVPADFAMALYQSVRDEGFDPAISYRMRVDHGVTIPLLNLAPSLTAYPVVPIWINCAGHPRPTFRRCREFGTAVGHFLAQQPQRVLVIGSGGLSHDPPTPRPGISPPEELEWFMEKNQPPQEELDRREARATKAGIDLANGKGRVMAPNEAWDRRFLDLLMNGEVARCDAFTDDMIDKEAGFGAHEVRTWIAAAAAASVAGANQRTLDRYRCIPDWLTGMGIMRAVQA